MIFLAIAGISESFALLCYYPFDLIKTRMQAGQEKYGYITITDAFMKIYRGGYSPEESKYL